jgi:hypothetical protein
VKLAAGRVDTGVAACDNQSTAVVQRRSRENGEVSDGALEQNPLAQDRL